MAPFKGELADLQKPRFLACRTLLLFSCFRPLPPTHLPAQNKLQFPKRLFYIYFPLA